MQTAPYRIVLAELETGIVLNRDGSRHLSTDGPRWEPTFQLLEDALALKDRLLAEFPFAEVNIFGGPEDFQPIRFAPGDRGRAG